MIKHLVLFLFVFSTVIANAQLLEEEKKAINNTIPPESIFIHFDRTVYTPGDTVWFKAYLRQGVFPSIISTSLFIELFDGKGNALSRMTLPILYYSAQGCFILPDTMATSLIAVRAYTAFMIQNKTSLYHQFLPVVASSLDVVTPAIKKKSNPVIEFFPEGGHLVANVPSVIAFKAFDENNQSADVKGFVHNKHGDTLVFFKTTNNGLGSFVVKADAEALTAVWWTDEQSKFTTALPAVRNTPKLEVAKNPNGDYKFRVVRNPDVITDKSNYYLLVYTTGIGLFEAAINLKKSPYSSGIISSDSLPEGIISFTLLDEKKNVVSERRIYHLFHKQSVPLSVVTSENGFGKRQLNTFELLLPDDVFTNMSIAVYDAGLIVHNAFNSNISESFLINVELDGKIQNTQAYFKTEQQESETLIDLLMLTHEWKHSMSKSGLAPSEYILPKSMFIQLKGKVTGLNTEEISKSGKLNMLFTTADSTVQLIPMAVSENGSFELDNLVFFDSAKLSFYFDKKPKKKFEVEIEPPFINDTLIAKVEYPSYDISKQTNVSLIKQFESYREQDSILRNNRYRMLKEITVTGKKRTREDVLDETYTTGQFKNDRAFRFDIINDPYFNTYTDIVSYLRGKVPGLKVSQGSLAGADLQISWRAQPTLVYVDEQYVFTSTLLNIPIDQIAYVKVFRPVFFGLRVVTEFEANASVVTNPSVNESAGTMKQSEFFGSGGAIAIYTKRNYAAEQKKVVMPVAESKSFIYKGYSSSPQFYSPDYVTERFDNTWVDNRKTLYWNPIVITEGGTKKFTIQFYNNDMCKAYKIVVQGMRADGKLVWFEQVVE